MDPRKIARLISEDPDVFLESKYDGLDLNDEFGEVPSTFKIYQNFDNLEGFAYQLSQILGDFERVSEDGHIGYLWDLNNIPPGKLQEIKDKIEVMTDEFEQYAGEEFGWMYY